MVLRAVKIRLYPNSAQKQLLFQHFGATRFIYNTMLDKKLKDYKNGIKTSAYDLKKLLPQMKKQDEFHWLKNIDSQCLGESILNMDRAFKNFFRKIKKGFSKVPLKT